MNKYNVLRAMTRDGSARVTVINSTDIVNEAAKCHHPAPTSLAALGRALTATSMMGAMLKEKEDTLTLRIFGDGACGAIVAVSDYMGNVRGYMQNPDADLPVRSDGKLDVRGVVGKGELCVTREFGGGAPQSGTVKIVSGEIAEDICSYFATSEQTPTECALGVLVDTDGTCLAAGGLMIQLLPFADDATVEKIEANAPKISNISSLVSKGLTNSEILALALDGVEYDEFDDFTAEYKCRCQRDNFKGAIASFSKKELDELFAGDETIETCCKFCGKKYSFSKAEIYGAKNK
ncbi:MAG: Hsp33 family molecular chaperone HslO [Clostridiales bacterium]|nr:Hsp33 family molecular chaperone HslO [Clostridiales bacterium]